MRRTAYTSSSAIAGLALLAAGCASGAPPITADLATVEAAVEDVLDGSAAAWNAGDLDGYVSYYAPDATFGGATGLVHGAEEIRRRYAEGYWSSGRPADDLRFEILDVQATGPGSALTFGRYMLEDRETGEPTSAGYFTLVLRQVDGSWMIVHDHSTAEAPRPLEEQS